MWGVFHRHALVPSLMVSDIIDVQRFAETYRLRDTAAGLYSYGMSTSA
jgi:hypothetical protein